MRTAYTKPTDGERYLVDKRATRELARSLDPALELLAFQTRHGPNMTRGLVYCATYSRNFLRILSVEDALISDAMSNTFAVAVVPWLLRRIVGLRVRAYSWPLVVVVLDGAFVEVRCAAGGLFPSEADARRSMKADGREALIAAIV